MEPAVCFIFASMSSTNCFKIVPTDFVLCANSSLLVICDRYEKRIERRDVFERSNKSDMPSNVESSVIEMNDQILDVLITIADHRRHTSRKRAGYENAFSFASPWVLNQ